MHHTRLHEEHADHLKFKQNNNWAVNLEQTQMSLVMQKQVISSLVLSYIKILFLGDPAHITNSYNIKIIAVCGKVQELKEKQNMQERIY